MINCRLGTLDDREVGIGTSSVCVRRDVCECDDDDRR
jgi:hypothetical protein